MWHDAQRALPKKISSPRFGSPATGGWSPAPPRLRMNATSCHVSASGRSFGGICVPGTPLRIALKMSLSLPHSPEVRFGPRPPPFPSRPWQNEQRARKSSPPASIAAGLRASGFRTGSFLSFSSNPAAQHHARPKARQSPNPVRSIFSILHEAAPLFHRFVRGHRTRPSPDQSNRDLATEPQRQGFLCVSAPLWLKIGFETGHLRRQRDKSPRRRFPGRRD